ncbi:MAG: T9SS type A sorting domain-containing protein [Dysgonamonadaceae bacterium]|jgi:hypothetical protein|nr:T9SS type A sorting domain-containing protein [Dysgonamonadaceae bacterium]
MIHRKKSTARFTLIALAALLVQCLQAGNPGADRWCINRITIDNTTSSTQFAVVDNPLKEAGTNESDKVLELSHIDQKGSIALNLTRYIGSAADRISDISAYNGLRFKYFILNPPYPSYTARIRMNGLEDVIAATWTNQSRQWKTASFAFPKNSQASWIQISSYYIPTGGWNDAFPGMKIYIDDLELFDSQYTGTASKNRPASDEVNIDICGKHLSVSTPKAGATISIYDICGRKLYSATSPAEAIRFTFPEAGIYLLVVKDRENFIRRKIILKE